jgi:hypothetical protein
MRLNNLRTARFAPTILHVEKADTAAWALKAKAILVYSNFGAKVEPQNVSSNKAKYVILSGICVNGCS